MLVTGTFPPARLRAELEHARESGTAFSAAWSDAVQAALAGLHHDKTGWRTALNDTRRAWHAAYIRAPGPGDSLARELFPSD